MVTASRWAPWRSLHPQPNTAYTDKPQKISHNQRYWFSDKFIGHVLEGTLYYFVQAECCLCGVLGREPSLFVARYETLLMLQRSYQSIDVWSLELSTHRSPDLIDTSSQGIQPKMNMLLLTLLACHWSSWSCPGFDAGLNIPYLTNNHQRIITELFFCRWDYVILLTN